MIFQRFRDRWGGFQGDSGRGLRDFRRMPGFSSEDSEMPKPGWDFGSISGGSVVLVSLENIDVSITCVV